MKGWIIKDKKLQLVDRPMPLLTRETILVDNKIAAICGSDIGTILNFGAVDIYKEGIILGHEFAGAVRQINSLNFKFEFGDKVAVNPYIPCKKCFNCKNKNFNLCENLKIIGAHINGGFGEYSLVPAENLIPLGDLLFELGCFVQPVACALAATEKLVTDFERSLSEQMKKILAKDAKPPNILILGGGPMGLIIGYMCKETLNAKIIVAETNWQRKKYALNITTEILAPLKDQEKVFLNQVDIKTDGGADIVVDTAGNLLTLAQKCAKEKGRILLFGLKKGAEKNQYELTRREAQFYSWSDGKQCRVLGSFLALPYHFNQAIEWMKNSNHQNFMRSLVSHKIPLSELEKGVSLLQKGEAMKVLVTY